MADKKFTLLELHLDEGSIRIGPSTIGDESGGVAEPESTDVDEGDDDGGTCPGRKAGKLLVVFLVFALLAAGVKKALGGGDDIDELEDLADLDAET
jgi:hypothetical protein